MSNTCNFRTSEASTKAWFRTNGLIDKSLNIPEGRLIEFRKQNIKWSDYAAKQYGITGRLFTEEAAGKKAVPNKEMFYKIDAAKGIFYPANAYLQKESKSFDKGLAQNIQDILQKLYPEIKLIYTNSTIDEINSPDVFNQELFDPSTHRVIVRDLLLPLRKAERSLTILSSKNRITFLSTAEDLIKGDPLKYLRVNKDGSVHLNVDRLSYDAYKLIGEDLLTSDVRKRISELYERLNSTEGFEEKYQEYLNSNQDMLDRYNELISSLDNIENLSANALFKIVTTVSPNLYTDKKYQAKPTALTIATDAGERLYFSYNNKGELEEIGKIVKSTENGYTFTDHEPISKDDDLWIDAMVALDKFKKDPERIKKAINILILEKLKKNVAQYLNPTSREDFFDELKENRRETSLELFNEADIIESDLYHSLNDILMANGIINNDGILTRSFAVTPDKLLKLNKNAEYSVLEEKKKKINNILKNKDKFNNDYDKYEDPFGDSDVLAPMPGWFLNAVSVASNGKYFDEITGLFRSKIKLFITMNAQEQYDALMENQKTPYFQILADTKDINSLITNRITFKPEPDLSNDLILFNQKDRNRIIGQANIKAMTVLIDAVNQKQDTLPHEYAHHYIAWFRDTPIVQEAIKKWGSEEALVQAIGEQVVKQKGEAYSWWKKFVEWILNKFGAISELNREQLSNILTNAFLTRTDISKVKNLQTTPQQIKPGVEEVFASNSELASIGTPEQYSKYLETKDTPIVYHGSPEYFEQFDTSKLGSYTGAASAKEGFFFGSSKDVSRSYLDKKGQTLNVDNYIKSKYGSIKKFEEDAIAYEFFSDNLFSYFAVLHDGTVLENVEQYGYQNTEESIFSDRWKNVLDAENISLDKIKKSINSNKVNEASLFKKYIARGAELKDTYDENYGGYIDKRRSITDKPFEYLFIRPFTLKLKNPLIVSDEGKTYREETYYDRIQKAKEAGHDGLIIKDTYDSKFQTKPEDIYVVFNPDSITEVGSKEDIAEFKKFLGISDKATQPVLVNQTDIDRFNTAVERSNGLKPSEFYTSDKDFDFFTDPDTPRTQEDRTASKWLLNEEGVYDLVDQFTGEIYLRNVDLSTGKQVPQIEDITPVNNKERRKFIKSLVDGVNEYRLDEIMAERGYDINEIIDNLEAVTTQKEFVKIVTKVLKNIC